MPKIKKIKKVKKVKKVKKIVEKKFKTKKEKNKESPPLRIVNKNTYTPEEKVEIKKIKKLIN